MEPDTKLWAHLFFLKQQGLAAGVMSDCGATIVSTWWNRPFPKMPLEDSTKKRQDSFFYVRNVGAGADCINLPPSINEPPHAKMN